MSGTLVVAMDGWIKMPLGREIGLGRGHIVLDMDPAPLPQRGTATPYFSAHVVAKRSPISATAEHLLPHDIGLCNFVVYDMGLKRHSWWIDFEFCGVH